MVKSFIFAIATLLMVTPALAGNHDDQECFKSKHQAWKVHPGKHLYHHATPNGMCYHTGGKNRSGVFTKVDTPKVKDKVVKHKWPKLYDSLLAETYWMYETPKVYTMYEVGRIKTWDEKVYCPLGR